MKKLVVKLVGKTANELMGNLNSLINQACKAKNDSADKDWPTWISATDEGEIRVVEEDQEVKSRMEHYEELMKAAAFHLQFAESSEARAIGFRLMGAMRH